ncbi:hypothetical protein M2164_006378 [Streptomyces sp. SAI-208]|nr:hypothetical protein [Streptomyces sp. SAI-208]
MGWRGVRGPGLVGGAGRLAMGVWRAGLGSGIGWRGEGPWAGSRPSGGEVRTPGGIQAIGWGGRAFPVRVFLRGRSPRPPLRRQPHIRPPARPFRREHTLGCPSARLLRRKAAHPAPGPAGPATAVHPAPVQLLRWKAAPRPVPFVWRVGYPAPDPAVPARAVHLAPGPARAHARPPGRCAGKPHIRPPARPVRREPYIRPPARPVRREPYIRPPARPVRREPYIRPPARPVRREPYTRPRSRCSAGKPPPAPVPFLWRAGYPASVPAAAQGSRTAGPRPGRSGESTHPPARPAVAPESRTPGSSPAAPSETRTPGPSPAAPSETRPGRSVGEPHTRPRIQPFRQSGERPGRRTAWSSPAARSADGPAPAPP